MPSCQRCGGVDLTDRQRQYLTLYVGGLPIPAIARGLGVTTNTAKNILQTIRGLAGTTTAVETLLWAVANGHVDLEPLLKPYREARA